MAPDMPAALVLLLAAGGLATAALAVASLVRLASRLGSRLMRRWRDHRDVADMRNDLRQLLADWHGTPSRPGVPARFGVLERLERTDQRLAEVERHLGNGDQVPLRDLLEQLVREQKQEGGRTDEHHD